MSGLTLTKIRRRQLVDEYIAGKTITHLARKYKKSIQTIYYSLRMLGVTTIPTQARGRDEYATDGKPPTPKEIQQRKMKIQNTWSEETREDRVVEKVGAVTVTMVTRKDKRRRNHTRATRETNR